MSTQDKIAARLKEIDELIDKTAKTPEKAEWGKKEIRDQLEKMSFAGDRFKLMALDISMKVVAKGLK